MAAALAGTVRTMMGLLNKAFIVVRQPATPFVIIGAVLLGLLLAGVTILFAGAKAPVHYINLPEEFAVLSIPQSATGIEDQDDGTIERLAPLIDRSALMQGAPPIDIDLTLVEATEVGLLPITGPNGERAFDTYRRRGTTPSQDSPSIALVLTELGMLYDISEKAALLPAEISLAYSPYAPQAADWLAHGRSKGHEVLLELPLKPSTDDVDRGPLTLTPSMPRDRLIEQLHTVLAQASGYIGVIGDVGAFAEELDAIIPIMQQMSTRGVAWVELDGNVLEPLALEQDLPYIAVRESIDSILDSEWIFERLQDLEAEARDKGHAIAYLRPYPLTLDIVWRWGQGLKDRGLELQTLSHYIEEEFRSR